MEITYREGAPGEDELYALYQGLGWNDYLKLDAASLGRAMRGSWLCVSAYLDGALVGTGRIVSDGVVNAYLCGVGVVAGLRRKGIGSGITTRLAAAAKDAGLHLQLMADGDHAPYYAARGFSAFAVGMKAESQDWRNT